MGKSTDFMDFIINLQMYLKSSDDLLSISSSIISIYCWHHCQQYLFILKFICLVVLICIFPILCQILEWYWGGHIFGLFIKFSPARSGSILVLVIWPFWCQTGICVNSFNFLDCDIWGWKIEFGDRVVI